MDSKRLSSHNQFNALTKTYWQYNLIRNSVNLGLFSCQCCHMPECSLYAYLKWNYAQQDHLRHDSISLLNTKYLSINHESLEMSFEVDNNNGKIFIHLNFKTMVSFNLR